MEKKYFKSIMGIAFLFSGALVITQYQNCAPAGSSNAFVLGTSQSASTLAPLPLNPIATVLAAGVITLPSATFQVNAPITATSVITNGGASVSCNWSIVNSTSVVVATSTTTSTSGVCDLSMTAPATAAAYTLNLTVTNSTTQTAAATTTFTTQAAVVVSTYSASLTPSPVVGIYDETVFKFTGQAVSNTPQIFTVVIGTVSGGVKTPIPGCSFVSPVAVLTYSPVCSTVFTSIGTVAMYVNITAKGQTLNCQVDSASCTGTYAVTVRDTFGGGGGNK